MANWFCSVFNVVCAVNVCPVHAVDLYEWTLRGLSSSLDKNAYNNIHLGSPDQFIQDFIETHHEKIRIPQLGIEVLMRKITETMYQVLIELAKFESKSVQEYLHNPFKEMVPLYCPLEELVFTRLLIKLDLPNIIR